MFSGDLASEGKSEEYAIAEKWLSRLVAPWKGCAVFVVPGNHDVSRANAKKPLLRYAGHKPDHFTDWLQGDDSGIFSHLDNFRNWHATARDSLRLGWNWSDSPVAVQRQISMNGFLVNMIGLNTALLSCDNDDRGELAVDISTLNQMLDNTLSDQLNIVVGHHPIKGDSKEVSERWMAEWNDQALYRALSQVDGAHLYLHGHVHETKWNRVNQIEGPTLTVFGAGAAYQGSNWPQAFAFYDIVCKDQKVHPHTYKYNHRGVSGCQTEIFPSQSWLRCPKCGRPQKRRLPFKRLLRRRVAMYLSKPICYLKEWSGAQAIWLLFLADATNVFAPHKGHSGLSANEIQSYQDTAIHILIFSPSAIPIVLEFTLSVLRDLKETGRKTINAKSVCDFHFLEREVALLQTETLP